MLPIGLICLCLWPVCSEQENGVDFDQKEDAVENVGTGHQIVAGNADLPQIAATTTNKTT